MPKFSAVCVSKSQLTTSCVFLALFFASSYSKADIIVTSRYSDAVYDVFAAVGPNGERRREVPDPLESLIDPFDYSWNFTGEAEFDNGEVQGTANAGGTYNRFDDLNWTANRLDLQYQATSTGSATSSGDGQAFSNMGGVMQVRFSLDVPTEYSYSLEIVSPQGLADSSILFENLFTDFINTSTPGSSSGSGILPAGDYNLFINSGGGDQNLNPPFATGIGFTLGVGAAVPEPSGVLCVGMSVLGLISVRRNRRV